MTQDLGYDLHELFLKSYVVAAVGYSLKSYVAATRERVASLRPVGIGNCGNLSRIFVICLFNKHITSSSSSDIWQKEV